jgi:hypothetical protein
MIFITKGPALLDRETGPFLPPISRSATVKPKKVGIRGFDRRLYWKK